MQWLPMRWSRTSLTRIVQGSMVYPGCSLSGVVNWLLLVALARSPAAPPPACPHGTGPEIAMLSGTNYLAAPPPASSTLCDCVQSSVVMRQWLLRPEERRPGSGLSRPGVPGVLRGALREVASVPVLQLRGGETGDTQLESAGVMEGVLENGWVLLPSHSAATKEARSAPHAPWQVRQRLLKLRSHVVVGFISVRCATTCRLGA